VRCLTIPECQRWREENSRRRTFKHQITCLTPLKRLGWFSDLLVDHLLPFESVLLIVVVVVFEPGPRMQAIRAAAGEHRPLREAPGPLFEQDPVGFKAMLGAALSEWIDLRVIFSAPRHGLRADHDEYTTFFSSSAQTVADVRRALLAGGVAVAEYVAESP
jgi:hypothetical protein